MFLKSPVATVSLAALLCYAASTSAFAQDTTTPPDEAINTSGQSDIINRIPEPMVFDLVRPLNSLKGELEVNTLFQQRLSGKHRRLEWAPEIEWAYANGRAVELELPVEGTTLTAYKFAFQGLIRDDPANRFIHGWQVIGRYDKPEKTFGTDLLYLTGYRFNSRWSVFSISGIRFPNIGKSGSGLVALINPSVYYNLPSNLTFGVEVNSEVRRSSADYLLIMPQLHVPIGKQYTLQFGVGANRYRGESMQATSALRFVRQL